MAAESHPAHRREQLGLLALVSCCAIGSISSGARYTDRLAAGPCCSVLYMQINAAAKEPTVMMN
jgi:hypothetical protein